MSRNYLLASTNDARSTLSAAISYARLGFRPTPTVAGRPRRIEEIERALRRSGSRNLECEEDVRAVWRHEDDGVGLLTGPCSVGDLVAIVASEGEGRATLRALDERYGRPPTTLTGSTSAGDIQLVYRVVVPLESSDRLMRAYGRSSDSGGPRRDARKAESPSLANLIRNWGKAESLAVGLRCTLHGLDVRVVGSQIPVACGSETNGTSRPRWTRPMLPAELPAEWYEALVEATNR